MKDYTEGNGFTPSDSDPANKSCPYCCRWEKAGHSEACTLTRLVARAREEGRRAGIEAVMAWARGQGAYTLAADIKYALLDAKGAP